jgi:hypothetical protein
VNDAWTAWDKRCADKHADEVTAGLHDWFCEYQHRPGFYLCHCSFRHRVAEGNTEPLDRLDFPPPFCPRCDDSLTFDGDGWDCRKCKGLWSTDGEFIHFSDFYGDDIPSVIDGVLQVPAVTP